MTIPEILSIQVGKPADHGADAISDKPWRSGIFKYPVAGRVWLGSLNLVGDAQDDLKVHGGPFRALLVYAAAHYPEWRAELELPDLPYGAFGENFTVTELTEDTVCLGDVYKVGEALIRVAQPRRPCFKVARRWGIKDLTARVEQKGWGGWYNTVLQEGYVQAGDTLTLVERPYPAYTVRFVDSIITGQINDPRALEELAQIEALTDTWREKFAQMAEGV